MITSQVIKDYALRQGAHLCGIASVDRFADAPKGFHPTDVYKPTRSAVALACRVPASALEADSYVPYTVAEDVALARVNQVALSLSLLLEDEGFHAVMIPSVPYDYWEEDTLTGRGTLSLKHIGREAGLGFIGKNSLLCNPRYGTMIKLGALLTDAVLQPDELVDIRCPDSCGLCIKKCPEGAIGADGSVAQWKCRPHSEIQNKRGVDMTVCYVCRQVCPHRFGLKHGRQG